MDITTSEQAVPSLSSHDLHLTNDDDDDKSRDLMTFSMQLIHHSHLWKSLKQIMCGSSAEIPISWTVNEYLNLNAENLDSDVIFYDSTRYAFHRSALLPETYSGDIIRIYTDDTHTGYVRLIWEKDDTEVLSAGLFKLRKDDTIHGPALKTSIRNYYSPRRTTITNSDNDTDAVSIQLAEIYVTFLDLVPAVHSPYWPVEATEWITRRRSHGFPAKSVIKRVVSYECDFVQVSHNRSSNDGEWRFSFSNAERLISNSWMISQRIVYSTLWALNKKMGNSNLCTYYFKTLMFWACEEKPAEFWNDSDLLVQSVRELLIEIMKWVTSKFCANYFIPGNNMMDHLIDTDLSHEADSLWRMSQSLQIIMEVIKICRQEECIASNTTFQIVSPAWISRACVIYQQVHKSNENSSKSLDTDITTDLQNALYVELSNILRGLLFQQKSVRCVNVSDKHSYFLKSECHMLLAVNLCGSQEPEVMDNCSLELINIINDTFLLCETKVWTRESSEPIKLNTESTTVMPNFLNAQKSLLYSRSVKKHKTQLGDVDCNERTSKGRNFNIAMYKILKTNTSVGTKVEFFKEWPGESPTVNISWFIAKGYLANLYYTIQRDSDLTMKTCDDIIDVYTISFMNISFAERTFPFILTTQWTSIYDKEIQMLLGFFSLCSYTFDPSSRAVYLGVCPVLFALYLKLRLVRDLTHIRNYNAHISTGHCDKKLFNGCRILTNAYLQFICNIRKQKTSITILKSLPLLPPVNRI